MGLGAALIMPSTLSILTNTFHDPRERKQAIGIWSGVSGIGVAVGPWLGGWLLEHYWWGSIFLINVAVAVAGLVLGALLVPESRDPHAPRLDLPGALLSTGGLVALVWAIIEAPARGWTDPWVLAGFAVAVVVLAGFVGWELHTERPMLDMRFFRRRRFSVPSISIALVFFALFGSAFFLSIYLQTVAGFDALSAGVRILPIAVGLVLGAPLSMALAVRVGEKIPTVLGLLGIAGSFVVIAGTDVDTAYAPRILVAIVLLGFGIAFAMTPATEAVMGSLPRAKAGVGSAVNDMVRQVGGALGVAVLGSVLNAVYSARVSDALVGLPPPAAAAAGDNLQAAYGVAATMPGDGGATLLAAAEQAFVEAMDATVLVAAALVLLGALIAAVWLPSHGRHPDDPDEAEAAEGSGARVRPGS
jgi:EmrB/QacA subfamily drug resistance transporter